MYFESAAHGDLVYTKKIFSYHQGKGPFWWSCKVTRDNHTTRASGTALTSWTAHYRADKAIRTEIYRNLRKPSARGLDRARLHHWLTLNGRDGETGQAHHVREMAEDRR